MVEDIRSLLVMYGGDEVFELTEQGKILCKLTSHEFACRIDEFKKYVQTKKFLRAYGLHKFMAEHGEYFEELGNNLYGCKLTLRTISNNPDSLIAHINGQKFKNALRKRKEKDLEEAKKTAESKDEDASNAVQKDEDMLSSSEEVEEEEEEVEPSKPSRARKQLHNKPSTDIGQFKTKRQIQTGFKRNSVKKSRQSSYGTNTLNYFDEISWRQTTLY